MWKNQHERGGAGRWRLPKLVQYCNNFVTPFAQNLHQIIIDDDDDEEHISNNSKGDAGVPVCAILLALNPDSASAGNASNFSDIKYPSNSKVKGFSYQQVII